LSRTESFSAAHRLHSEALSPEENRAIYGKCNNEWGHGHNYKVILTVVGLRHPATQMVVSIDVLRELLAPAVAELDHHHLDREPRSAGFPPIGISTAEGLAEWFWTVCSAGLHRKRLMSLAQVRLYCVEIIETECNVVRYYG
ncbi:hypothetical protein CXG81DRAFT_1647, partial [Caulochytrium protostelioides]